MKKFLFNILAFSMLAGMAWAADIQPPGTGLRFFELPANGSNFKAFAPPASVTANTTCTFENDANFIPDSCVGDGTDNTGLGDGNYGDVTVSGGGTIITINANSVALGTDTTGNYAAGDAEAGAALTGDSATAFFTTGSLEMARGGTGDGAAASDDQTLVSDSTSAATWRTLPDSDGATQKLQYDQTTNTFSAGTDDDVPEVGDFGALVGGTGITNSAGTLSFDATELGNLTWGSGTGFAWTFDVGAIDPLLTFASDAVTLTNGALTVGDVGADINGFTVANPSQVNNTGVQVDVPAASARKGLNVRQIGDSVSFASFEWPQADLPRFCFGPGGAAARDICLARSGTNIFEINNGTAGTFAELKLSKLTTSSSIELGAATDTTVARVSAGTISVEGSNVLTALTGQPLDADLTSWAAITRAAGYDTFATTPSSANLRALLTDEIGTGVLVFLGTPADDAVPVGDSASATTWRVIPDCDTALSSKLLYDQTTNTFSCGTDQTSGGGGTIGGADTQVQFNDGGTFGGDADFTWNKTTNVLTDLGTIELGAATDTTIARSAAGQLNLEGVAVATASNTLGLTNKTLTNVGTALATFMFSDGTQAFTPDVQAVGAGVNNSTLGAARFSAVTATTAARTVMARSRGTTVGDYSVVQSGDVLGAFIWDGSDGTDFAPGAELRTEVDGTPGNNDMPGRMVFATTADGANAVTDRWIIDSLGALKGAADNTVDLGTQANAVRTAHIDTSIELGGTGATITTPGAGEIAVEGNTVVRSGTTAGGDLTGTYPNPTVAANAVALGTDTTGNYQSGNTAGTGIAVTQTPAEGFSATIAFDYSDAGANPTLGVDECRFTSNATVAGNIVCEGDTADGIETRIAIADPATTDKTFTIPNADSNPVQPLTCGSTDKVSAISSAGVITCTADVSAAGGDSIRVEDGDNAGTFTAMSDADFDDSGDINFARTAGPPDVLTATVRADSVALGTDTTGNYVGTVADGTGIDGTCATENCTYTPVLDLTEINTATFGSGTFTALVFDAGATDPTFTFASNAVTVSNAATFSLGTSAVFTTGTIELGAATDTTIARSGSGVATLEGVEITTNSGTQTLTNKSIAATQITAGALNIGNNAATVGTVEMANGTANTLSAAAGVLSIEGNAILSAISSAGGDLTGTYPNPTVAANAVALTTDTTGNYMADIAAGAGIATTHTPAEGSTGTIALDYSDAGADPALAADTCRFTGDATTNGEIVCEGDTANTFETRFVITDPTADRVFTIPNADSVAVQPLTCGTTDKVSAVSALGVITCTADVSGSVSDGDKGDITVTGTGTTWTVDNDVVTFAKMQNIATDSLIGRDTAATGDPENILLNATLSMDGAGNLQRAALTGDVTASAGSNATTVAADAVALGTDTTGVYVSQVADGTGIDGTCNSETCTYTPTLDLTEINTATFGSGTFTALVFDAGATDPTFTMASNAVTVSNAATFSLGTTAAFTAGTIELGAASDTTLSRSGAGAVQVEGVQVVLNASSPTLGTLTTTGNIELGNASDTTLSRDAAGSLAVEGQKVKRVGTETIYIPGAAMQPTVTSGCGFSNRETNGITINVPACDTTAGESVLFDVVLPKSWNAGTITYRFNWTNAAGASTQTVQFTLACGSFADNTALNTTGLGTAVAVSDTWLAQNSVHRSAVSSAVTCSNAAVDVPTYFKMTRDVANDNMAGDAEILGVELFYTSSAANDT